jgi:hypothetical protein
MAARSTRSVPVSYPPAGLSDSPIPRWSTATTSTSQASAGMSRRQAYQVSGQRWTSNSGGPSPPMTACWRSAPVSMYWLMKVSVNPSGRFGAPGDGAGAFGSGQWGRRCAREDLLSQGLAAFDVGDATKPARLICPSPPCGSWSTPWSTVRVCFLIPWLRWSARSSLLGRWRLLLFRPVPTRVGKRHVELVDAIDRRDRTPCVPRAAALAVERARFGGRATGVRSRGLCGR